MFESTHITASLSHSVDSFSRRFGELLDRLSRKVNYLDNCFLLGRFSFKRSRLNGQWSSSRAIVTNEFALPEKLFGSPADAFASTTENSFGGFGRPKSRPNPARCLVASLKDVTSRSAGVQKNAFACSTDYLLKLYLVNCICILSKEARRSSDPGNEFIQ